MKTLLEYKTYLTAAADQGGQPVNIFVGRFQPFHLGHLRILETLRSANQSPSVVIYVKGKDVSRHFFSEELTLRMLRRIKEANVGLIDVVQAKSDNLEELLSILRPKYEPRLWGAGEDRVSKYQMQIDSLRKKEFYSLRKDFKTLELVRSGDEIGDVSATKIRGYIKNNDQVNFQKSMPEVLWGFWYELCQTLEEKVKKNEFKNRS